MSFFSLFKLTIPVLMGYIPAGIAFGLLAVNVSIEWYWAVLMSLFVYAGAGQFLLATMLSVNASLFDISLATFLLNIRHSFYGLSMIGMFKNIGKMKPYLIFGLTDETFALLQTAPKVLPQDRKRVFFLITILNQTYWLIGTLIGVTVGNLIKIDYKGIEFALSALFVVLSIELYKKYPNKRLLCLSLLIGASGMVFLPSSSMLVISLSVALALLLGLKNWINGGKNE